jgi:hypothetical protein
MSRDHNSWRLFEKMPRWYRAAGNPPPKYRRRWRREVRVKLNRAVRRDPEGFQPFAHNRITSIYDWY